MLSKLLKYDLRYIFKTVVIYYGAAIVCAVLGRFILSFEPLGLLLIIGKILEGAGIGLGIGLFVHLFARTWARFFRNVYGAEGYLTGTLPVKRSTVYISKLLAAVIALVVSLLACVIYNLLTTTDLLECLKFLFRDADLNFFYTPFNLIVSVSIIGILECIALFQSGFTGIIAANRFNSHRKLIGTLIAIGTHLCVNLLVIGALLLWGRIDPAINEIVSYGRIWDGDTLLAFIYGSTGIYLAVDALVYCINQKLLKAGVNIN